MSYIIFIRPKGVLEALRKGHLYNHDLPPDIDYIHIYRTLSHDNHLIQH